MPISPASIIIGTTLAVIGSGYAFKKFIYDPHLSAYVEAFIQQHYPSAQHHETISTERRYSQPIPIPVPASSGRSTARTRSGTYDQEMYLRRRRGTGGPRRMGSQESLLGNGGGGYEQLGREEEEVWGKVGKLDTPMPLVDLSPDPPSEFVNKGVREVIFTAPITPLDDHRPVSPTRSGFGFPAREYEAGPSIPPSVSDAASTTPSLISLSPEIPPVNLPEISPSPPRIPLLSPDFSPNRTSPSSTHAEQLNRPDIEWEESLSLPDKTTTSYQDAETYSPFSDPAALQSPPGTGYITLSSLDTPPRGRRPESVISISDDEGWASEMEGEWQGARAGL